MNENLKWDEKTLPSQILRQVLEQETKAKDKTLNNIYALAFAIGKAEAFEYLHKKNLG